MRPNPLLLACCLPLLTPLSRAGAAPGAQAYAWRNVRIGGGGFVTGIVFHPAEPGLAYARTDVGGAYRWNGDTGRWTPLLDWVSGADWNLLGIESLAVDPSDPGRVYLAAGTYTGYWAGFGEILRSPDRGRTWKRARLPFRLGGNETGRFNGERLAVDPNCPRILFFGSRADGLWRSGDGAATWRPVAGFPALARGPAAEDTPSWDGPQHVGIVCLAFDPRSGFPGRPTPILYAAVSTALPSFYRSGDGGVTWSAVPGQPLGLRPNHAVLAGDGIFYLSYGKEPGPDAMTGGALWSWNSRTGAWTDISPLHPVQEGQSFGYGAVAVDPRRPEVLMASTFCRWKPHDEVFRSTDRGSHWKPLLEASSWDRSLAPWTAGLRPHWIGAIAIDPFDSNRVFFTTGYGLWEGTNLARTDRGEAAHWVFADHGLEETVPRGLISPPVGAHLLSAIADLDGFRHDDFGAAPPQFSPPPRLSSGEDIDFAEDRPLLVARVGLIRRRDALVPAGAMSADGGETWTPFAAAPRGGREMSSIAVSADGGSLVWITGGGEALVSTDRGRGWTPCRGAPSGLRIAADRGAGGRFYGFDPTAGVLFSSGDGGRGFTAVCRGLPAVPPGALAGPSALQAVPGIGGDLWLIADGRLLRSTDGGAGFHPVPSIDLASAVGFGKSAAPGGYPAVFLAGSAGGIDGIFRSDDAGRSWIRISDPDHQFAAIGRITGDPRLFGRVYLATGGRGILCGDPR